jgi:hypothetical protein
MKITKKFPDIFFIGSGRKNLSMTTNSATTIEAIRTAYLQKFHLEDENVKIFLGERRELKEDSKTLG